MNTFEANYWSKCAACGEDIMPGHKVVYDEDGQLIHIGCDDEV